MSEDAFKALDAIVAAAEDAPRTQLITEEEVKSVEEVIALINRRHELLLKAEEQYLAGNREEGPAINIDIDGLGPWSYSKYKLLGNCQFQFYLKYVLKVKVPERLQIQEDPFSAPVGTANHQILEDLMKGRTMDASFNLTKKDFVEKRIILPHEIWEERVESLRYNIAKFKERMENFDRQYKVKRVMTELKMGVTKNFEATGFMAKNVFIRGVIDLVLMLECMDILILDHKTGGMGGVKNYVEQLNWYKVLFHHGINPVAGAQAGVHFIKEGEVYTGDYTPKEEIEGNLRNMIELSIEGVVESLKQKGYFKHVRGSYCKWCDYNNLGCKSGDLKPLELSTKKFFPIHPAAG